jgi:hypothetical protein
MSKYILLFVLALYTIHATAQTGVKDGTITIDFGKKKPKQQYTIPQTDSDDEDSVVTAKKVRKQAPQKDKTTRRPGAYDIHELGIFRGLFHAGLNAAQVDGDNEYGYKYLGAVFGAGVMARFHPYVSTSLEINYSMQGARARLQSTDLASRRYMVQWDYIEVPIALNLHYRDIVMISGGLVPGFIVRYKELDNDGINVTKTEPLGQPRQFGLEAFAGIHFIISKHYALGFKYAYSVLKIRAAADGTRSAGQYNNLLTFRFMYILGSARKKK